MANFRWNILKVIVLSALFGFLSGVLGGLLIASVYAPVYGLHEQINNTSVARTGLLKETDRQTKMQSAIVSFYINRGGIPGSEDRVGYGTLLTTDGWIVTSQKVLRSGAGRLMVITSDRASYTLEKIIADSSTDAAFVKIKAERMPTLGTASAGDVSPDATLFSSDSNKRVYRLRYLGITYSEGSENTLHSSEKLEKFLFVSSPDTNIQPGGPLINGNGELVGIIDDVPSGRAVPFEYVYPAFRELLKTGKALRPYLGVNYLDLSALLYLRKETARGAEIISGAGRRGVLRGSPAADSGIVEGDIILKVNEDELGNKTSLSEVVSQYQIGSSISLLIRHKNGNEENKEVVITEKP